MTPTQGGGPEQFDEIARLNLCLRCGTDAGPDVPQPSRCGSCPPAPCSDCGEPDNAPCSCYTATADLAFADLKAVFAATDLSLEKS